MWIGDIPAELQGLTLPEQKLISLYRHNSCIIKLHSPFHSTTTAQTPSRKEIALVFFKMYQTLSIVYHLRLTIYVIH